MKRHVGVGVPPWNSNVAAGNVTNIRRLLWLSRRLIVSTEKSSIYITTFSKALTSKNAQNHRISIYFFNKLDRSQTPPQP